jgi:hypothetical protein
MYSVVEHKNDKNRGPDDKVETEEPKKASFVVVDPAFGGLYPAPALRLPISSETQWDY